MSSGGSVVLSVLLTVSKQVYIPGQQVSTSDNMKPAEHNEIDDDALPPSTSQNLASALFFPRFPAFLI